jgi:hypothetical protein
VNSEFTGASLILGISKERGFHAASPSARDNFLNIQGSFSRVTFKRDESRASVPVKLRGFCFLAKLFA